MPHRKSLFELARLKNIGVDRVLADAYDCIRLDKVAEGSRLGIHPEEFRGRCVLISTARQLPAVLALMELDGIAQRLVLCPTDVAPEHLRAAIADANVDVVLSDGTGPDVDVAHSASVIEYSGQIVAGVVAHREVETEWVLFTSGTSDRPKLVLHTLPSLIGPLADGVGTEVSAVWSTFYDVRRYGGLTILMRALVGGGSMVFSEADEPVSEFMRRAGAEKVTHISGTPSHWRRALMSAATDRMSPDYVRLSGEACDQSLLNALRLAFPNAGIAHAFASTEAGFAFDVRDGQAGFPASLIGQDGPVKLRVEDGSLRIRSSRMARRYLGDNMPPVFDASGFVDTGDLVELQGDRYYFRGRRSGVINVGGLKVHPEMVEAVINQHPRVCMSRVSARSSPITGEIVVAEIVVNAKPDAASAEFNTIKCEILTFCRGALAAHQVPAMMRQVASLEVAASGKLVRRHA